MPESPIITTGTLWLLPGPPAAEHGDAFWRWSWLWLILVILCYLLIRVVVSIGRRRGRLLSGPESRPRRAAIKDAWAEAGRRAAPIDPVPDDPTDKKDAAP